MSLHTKKTRTLIFDYSILLQKESVLYWREGLEVSVTTKLNFNSIEFIIAIIYT